MRNLILVLFVLVLPLVTFAHDAVNENQTSGQVLPGMMQNQLAPQGMMQMMGMGQNYTNTGTMMRGFGGWAWIGWLAMLASALFWVLVIVLLIGLIRWVWKKGSDNTTNPPHQQ